MSDVKILMEVVSALQGMDRDGQKRTLQAVATFLGISLNEIVSSRNNSSVVPVASVQQSVKFSDDRSMSAKAFMRDKSPKTDAERIACLAYYLTHYRDTPHFKTIDLSTLNMEAAQPKFSNATYAVDNAAKAGLLVQAVKGSKQLSAAGETFVQLLPDRDAARAGIATLRAKKKFKKNSPKKSS